MFPLRTSQTTTLPFWSRVRPPAARNLPSGLKSTALSLEKSAGESRDVCGSAWVRPIHISPVRVPPPDQDRGRTREEGDALDPMVARVERAAQPIGLAIPGPEPDGAVPVRHAEQPPVRREPHLPDPILQLLDRSDTFARRDVPDLQGPERTARCDPPAVRAERDADDIGPAGPNRCDGLPRADAGDEHVARLIRGRQHCAAGAEGDREHPSGVPAELVSGLPGSRVPNENV